MNMYEAKYSKYITKSHSRFAEITEIKSSLEGICAGKYASSGAPLYFEDGTLFVDGSDAHTMVIGPTGCKKSRTVAIPTVESIVSSGESAVIDDPKGEIYNKTSGLAKECGADVYVLNFRKPSNSHGWNPLTQAHKYYQRGDFDSSYQCITDFASNVIAPLIEKTVDRYWGDSSLVFLIALILILMVSVPEEYFNIMNLIQLSFEKNGMTLKKILEEMDQNTPAAFGLHEVLDLEADRTKSCIYSTLLSAMAPFSRNESLQNLLNNNDIDIENISEKQTIIYVIYPDEKDSLNFLINAFFTQCYETLITKSSEEANNSLKLRVNFVLDEFSNLPAIPNFDNRISEARSHNIRYFLFIQSFGQLQNKYKEHAETILSNCGNWICFSSKEIGFLKKISEICGTEVDYNGIEHDLISPCEMQHLQKFKDGAEAVIIRAGEYPYIVKLPDYETLEIFNRVSVNHQNVLKAHRTSKTMTFEQWIDGISLGRFKFPFPKKKPQAPDYENQKALEMAFDELFEDDDDED